MGKIYAVFMGASNAVAEGWQYSPPAMRPLVFVRTPFPPVNSTETSTLALATACGA